MVMKTRALQSHWEYVTDVQHYIHQHMDEPLQREVLAEVVGFSIPQLHRIFTATTGESIAAYVRRVRMERAARKLRMGAVDITEVALAAGYDSHAAFSKAFKQQFGVSPSEFRRLGCRAATALLHRKDADR
jgi:AraC family transcriptional regulator